MCACMMNISLHWRVQGFVICKLWKIKEVRWGALISQQLQITEALRRSGINESSTYVLVAHFDGTPDEVNPSLTSSWIHALSSSCVGRWQWIPEQASQISSPVEAAYTQKILHTDVGTSRVDGEDFLEGIKTWKLSRFYVCHLCKSHSWAA